MPNQTPAPAGSTPEKLLAATRQIKIPPHHSLTRWDAELLREQRHAKKSEYNRRYRLRHPEREKAMEPLYRPLESKQRGAEPPLPDWNTLLNRNLMMPHLKGAH
jgi:hypothetical protein